MGSFSPQKVQAGRDMHPLLSFHAWYLTPFKSKETLTLVDQEGFIPDHEDLLDIIRVLCDAYDTLTPEDIFDHNNAAYDKTFPHEARNGRPSLKKVEKPVRRPLKGYVYLVRHGDSDYYKIGMTSDCQQRMRSFQTASPEELTLIHSIKTNDMVALELYFHELFGPCRVRGEWFELDNVEVSEFLNYTEAVQ